MRKLAAIVLADVVGYSRQMAADEAGTLARLRALRAEVLDPRMAALGGRIVKLMGDGILAEFASAVSATAWAVSVQHAIAERNATIPESEAMRLRIGVNVGDVIQEEDDLFGDGVNVAARLEPLAPVGGVCISGAVYDHVAGKVDATFASGGERTLKNIARPVVVWCWSPPDANASLDQSEQPQTPSARPPRKQGAKPMLAVRPFDVTGAQPSSEAAFLASAVHDATVVALSNLSGITLLADTARADYVASATIQAVGTRYRAVVRLVDNRSGQQFWSDRFDGELTECFDAQDELALRISTAVRYSIYDREVDETERVPEAERTREMLFARVGQTIAGAAHEDWTEAGRILDDILAAEPLNSGAHAMKACWHLREALFGWRELAQDDCAAAVALARQSLRLNERSDFAHFTMATVHLYAERDPERALREAERSLQLSPYYAMGRYVQGLAQLHLGDPATALVNCVAAANASSRTVIHHRMLQGAAIAAFFDGRHGEAVEHARAADSLRQNVGPTLLVLACCLAGAGRTEDAHDAGRKVLAMFPEFSLGAMRRWPLRRAGDHDRFVGCLREAGLPD